MTINEVLEELENDLLYELSRMTKRKFEKLSHVKDLEMSVLELEEFAGKCCPEKGVNIFNYDDENEKIEGYEGTVEVEVELDIFIEDSGLAITEYLHNVDDIDLITDKDLIEEFYGVIALVNIDFVVIDSPDTKTLGEYDDLHIWSWGDEEMRRKEKLL